MNIWELAILKAIESADGQANTQTIYAALEGGSFIHLTAEHFKTQADRRAYENQVRSHLTNLTQAGDIHRVSRGVYQLTPKGRSRLLGL